MEISIQQEPRALYILCDGLAFIGMAYDEFCKYIEFSLFYLRTYLTFVEQLILCELLLLTRGWIFISLGLDLD